LLHPDSVRAIMRSGQHEIGLHGWIHERNSLLEEATERDLMMRSRDALEKLAGRRPVGMRTPSWDYSQNTLKIAKEMGLLYDSSLMADDRLYEMLADGQPTGVVQLPVEWINDDAPYFWNDRSTGVRPTMNPDEVLAIWKAEFDVAYEERTLFILTMHPHIIGHCARRDARPIDRAHEIQARRRLVRDARADRALREGAEVMETLRFRSSGERHQSATDSVSFLGLSPVNA
jgi:peptidoglycan/xylan/chitin deacetylase (PgdA/CDA1 family)